MDEEVVVEVVAEVEERGGLWRVNLIFFCFVDCWWDDFKFTRGVSSS